MAALAFPPSSQTCAPLPKFGAPIKMSLDDGGCGCAGGCGCSGNSSGGGCGCSGGGGGGCGCGGGDSQVRQPTIASGAVLCPMVSYAANGGGDALDSFA